MSWLRAIFDSTGLMPHGYCLLWNPALLWLHVASDAVIGLSYYSIPLALVVFVMRRPDIAFGWIFWTFAAFILLCGATHFVEIWTLWHPDYGFQGAIKALTAVASVGTAAALWPTLPKALAIPSHHQLRLAAENLAREVERRSRAVEALERERDFTELLVNSTSECVATMDKDLVVRLWSQSMAALTNQPPQNVVGRPIFELNPQLRGTAFEAAMRAALDGEERNLENELVGQGLPSAGRWVDARYSPLRDRDGRIVGCIVFLRDVTERHRMEEALRQAQKMEAIGQLTGGVAHDFNNFLTAVIGNLDLMGYRAKDQDPAVDRLRESALQGALRAATLTRQLLAFSRRQLLVPRLLDVNALVTGMSELIHSTLGEGIVTEIVLADEVWPTFADPNQLESALLNLTINARDAMPDGGCLSIETANAHLDAEAVRDAQGAAPGQFVAITVTDTGAGMTPEVLERAFDPFFTTKGVGQGSGLGLSQVYGFVTQSGGHIRIASEPGRGTSVKLYLPRRHGQAQEMLGREGDRARSPGTGPTARAGERVLVVEDERIVQQFIVDALHDRDYQVVAASDGAEALARLEESPGYDLLLTDLGLPGLNGRQLAAIVRERWPAMRVLFVSGYGRNAILDESIAQTGAEFLAKPFEARALAAAVRRALDLRTAPV